MTSTLTHGSQLPYDDGRRRGRSARAGRHSRNAAGLSVLEIVQFGAPGDLPVTGDRDGDRVTDLAVWSPQTATFTQGGARTPTAARAVVRQVRFGNPRP